MVGSERGCHLPVQREVAELRDSLILQWVMHANVIANTTTGAMFQGGHSAMFVASRRVRLGARRALYYSKRAYRGHCCTVVWGFLNSIWQQQFTLYQVNTVLKQFIPHCNTAYRSFQISCPTLGTRYRSQKQYILHKLM